MARAVRRVLALPVDAWHLASRFVTSLPDGPPSVIDEVWAEDHLHPAERRLWRRLANPDRRHSIVVARRFVAARPGASRAEIAGALLHDVGKIECRLGTFARVAATLVGPRTERFRAYHDHEAIGARLLADSGADVVTVRLVAGDGPAFETLRSADHA